MLNAQENEIKERLARLYDALETGKLTLDDVAPRIQDLRAQQALLGRSKAEVMEVMDADRRLAVSREELLVYLGDFRELLAKGDVGNWRTLLKSFIQRIEKRGREVTVHYTLPLPRETVSLGETGVLTLEQSGGRYWSRTSDLCDVR